VKIVLDPYTLRSVRGVTGIAAGVDHGHTGLSPPRNFVPSYIQRLAEVRMARQRVPERPAVQSSSSVDDQPFLGS